MFFNTLEGPFTIKSSKIRIETPKKSYIGSNSEDWKLVHQKNDDYGLLFGQKPSKKSKVDYANQIFNNRTPEKLNELRYSRKCSGKVQSHWKA